MEPKEKSLNNENNGGTDVKPEDKSSGSKAIGGRPAKKEVKTKKRRASSKKAAGPEVWSAATQVGVAIITAIGGFAIAWLNSPLGKPIPTPTATVTTSPISFITDTPTLSSTETPFPIITPSTTYTPTITITPTDLPATVTPGAKMEVYLYADKTSGRKPLRIKFDARDSYLREPNGTKFPCRGGPCNYIWKVYSNGTQLGKSVTDSGGTFEYSFGDRGVYLVTVDICRGRDKFDCGGAGIQIEVTR